MHKIAVLPRMPAVKLHTSEAGVCRRSVAHVPCESALMSSMAVYRPAKVVGRLIFRRTECDSLGPDGCAHFYRSAVIIERNRDDAVNAPGLLHRRLVN